MVGDGRTRTSCRKGTGSTDQRHHPVALLASPIILKWCLYLYQFVEKCQELYFKIFDIADFRKEWPDSVIFAAFS